MIWLIWTQRVRDLLSNVLTWCLTVTWLIWTQRVRDLFSNLLDFWARYGWFGLSGSAWFAFKCTDPISDGDMVDFDSQIVRDLLSNLLTRFLTMMWLIWTLRQCVICSQMYWPDFWPWYGWFGLSGSAWFALKCTDWISDGNMVDLDSQMVRDLLSNLLTLFLTVTWFIWTQRVRDWFSNLLDFWPWYGWFGLSGSAWFALKSTDPISDSDMVDLDSQAVRDLLSNVLARFLTVTWLIWTLRQCVICSKMYWPDFWPWYDWFGLSVCVWFALKCTDPSSDHDMGDLDSQAVRDLLSNVLTGFLTVTWLVWTLRQCVICSQIYWPYLWWWHGWFGLSGRAWFALISTDRISDGNMVDLDSQEVRDLPSNLLTLFLTVARLIWTLRKCVICFQMYWPDFWQWHGWFGLSGSAWFALKSTDQIPDHDAVDLDSQTVRDLLSNVLTRFLTMTWLIWTLRLCVICSHIYWLDFWQ